MNGEPSRTLKQYVPAEQTLIFGVYRELTHRIGEVLSQEPLGSPVELDLVLLVPEPCPSSSLSIYSTATPRRRSASTICSDSAFFTRGSFAPCAINKGV
jgi:hypothetical protein